MLPYLLSVSLLLGSVNMQLPILDKYEGETCTTKAGVMGVCKNLKNCITGQRAIEVFKAFPEREVMESYDMGFDYNKDMTVFGVPNNIILKTLQENHDVIVYKICSFKQTEPIVCCERSAASPDFPTQPLTTTPPTTTTQPSYFPVYDYIEITETSEDGCEALPKNMTAAKTNSKAWNKCLEYQLKYIYPCERTESIAGDKGRKNKCHHQANDLIVGGVDAGEAEFPHMVLLGYGDLKNVQWLCSGSIISEKFILTAGHCTVASRIGPVTYAKGRILKRSDENSKVYEILNIIKHPKYNSPNRYHDIALLETKTEMELSDQMVPACLDVGSPNDYTRALASGWGATLNRGSSADHLQKVILKQFSTPECASMFPKHRLMKQGFDPETQICYGDKEKSKDTCQGDSGGPLQLKSKEINCMYVVVGVTSFGHACGVIGEPGIYTRVAHYVPWIEDTVWK